VQVRRVLTFLAVRDMLIWLESDLPSRTRKCVVSLGGEPRSLGECEAADQLGTE
jgi:hypothetical protein